MRAAANPRAKNGEGHVSRGLVAHAGTIRASFAIAPAPRGFECGVRRAGAVPLRVDSDDQNLTAVPTGHFSEMTVRGINRALLVGVRAPAGVPLVWSLAGAHEPVPSPSCRAILVAPVAPMAC